jgi:hypothetical protein
LYRVKSPAATVLITQARGNASTAFSASRSRDLLRPEKRFRKQLGLNYLMVQLAKSAEASHFNRRNVEANGTGRIAIGGSIDKTAFRGAVAHVALWNRLLSGAGAVPGQLWHHPADPRFARWAHCQALL